MSVLTTSPYSLDQGDSVYAQVAASNLIGEGSLTADNAVAATVQVEPHQPSAAPTRDPTSSDTQLVVNWAALSDPEDGGSAVTSYHLQYDDASGGVTWTDLIGLSPDSLALTYTVSSSVTAGATYLFRYRAKNIHGWGDYSSTLSLLAASVPSAPAAPTTSNEDTSVKISWAVPSSNGGSAITGYHILI